MWLQVSVSGGFGLHFSWWALVSSRECPAGTRLLLPGAG